MRHWNYCEILSASFSASRHCFCTLPCVQCAQLSACFVSSVRRRRYVTKLTCVNYLASVERHSAWVVMHALADGGADISVFDELNELYAVL